ncbi:VOC family protein [Rhodohalobacter sulfatireducens]|uniref:VOC family protein n=1 Tax=Rhodohalobacter sulfatireducens TaxID=2911366 RepID=A0ABS9KG93_9BACT|nr:VOC family protein [Rhodohalobacter sulfatireducens]MCG2589869.1 VOC family protein [Rhodohalobacter sulfatireducens]
MNNQEKITYIELPAIDIPATKKFFEEVFNWTFSDYGDEYTAFSEERLEGGFYQSDKKSSTENGATLIIFYSDDLEASERKIRKAGGRIIKPIFSFPGGRRFHFTEPSGNELSVWSDK